MPIMTDNPPTAAPISAADVLRRAADAYRTHDLTWGTGNFIGLNFTCRCALGALAWAAYDADPEIVKDDGDPRFAGPAARQAMATLGQYLVDELGAAQCVDSDGDPDWVETVGGWNDEQSSVDPVIAALEAAAASGLVVSR